MQNKKISIIVPIYNSEEYLEKCLNSLIEQPYKEVEIIVVNDGSKGNCDEILKKYQEKDKRIKYIKHDQNKGLFQARITGVKSASGDYIAFLDADDYVSIDFYRVLVKNATENNSDIVMTNIILEFDNGRKVHYKLFDKALKELNGEECLKEYFNQEGLNFSWHTTPNKIYAKRIWDKALKYYEKIDKHLVMTEDFAFSTVLYYLAQKVTVEDNEAMFYCKHDGASTSINDITINKIRKNLTDLATSFGFVENFLKEVNVYEEYKEKFEKWRALYCKQHRNYVSTIELTNEEKKEVDKLFKKFCPKEMNIEGDNFFSSIEVEWNSELENIKKEIINPKTKVVSFDIFDTLVTRPFLIPNDMFRLLNDEFRKLTKNVAGIDFSKIRILCESLTIDRIKKQNPKYEEITIDEIYETLHMQYNIDSDILEKMKAKEKEYEIRFCEKRKTGAILYELAVYLGKKVILTSDMYLDEDTITKILKKNGYDKQEKLFLSANLRLTKRAGSLYDHVMSELKIKPDEMVHIGDNYNSDVEIPRKKGIRSRHLPRTINVFLDSNMTNELSTMFEKDMPFWQDNLAAKEFLGIRTMLAMVANKYFDNPFRPFCRESDFNADPYLIGYYALGMYLFGISKWLIDNVKEENYDRLVFMARDGFLPMQAYKIIKNLYNNMPEERYIYVSRKSLIPITLLHELDFYKLSEVINIHKNSPLKVLKYIKSIINVDEDTFIKTCNKNNINPNNNFKDLVEFNKFIKIVIDNFYNAEEHNKKLAVFKRYFKNEFGNKAAVFDVGYSARPEMFLSNLCDINLDTYFVNINQDEAFKHAEIGNFKLKTFFPYKPKLTGYMNELVLSAIAPSCIRYDIENGEVIPVFEEYDKNYQEEYVMSIMQNAALEFVKDMVITFGKEIDKLYYQNYYISMPFSMYIHSSKPVDRMICSAIFMEDDMNLQKKTNMTETWAREIDWHNQHTINQLTNINAVNNIGVDLTHRSRPVKLIYYMFFDRVTFKRRMNEIFGRFKGMNFVMRKTYHGLRKTRNTFYKIKNK